MKQFRLRFPERDIARWFSRYQTDKLNPIIEGEILPRVHAQGYLNKADFLTLCRWKTPRTQSRCNENSPDFIRSVSEVALSTNNEQLGIEVWRLLRGVDWPTASTMLHWLHRDEYPILDFRALWSLGYLTPPPYEFHFWWDYVYFCRTLAQRNTVSVRTLDRALWQYSYERQ